MYPINIIRRAEALFGYGIQTGTGERTYTVVDGVIYTDLFSGTPTIDGYTGTITTRFNGDQRTDYYNELVLEPNKCKQTVKVTAAWGSDSFLDEINELLEWLADNPFTDMADNSAIKSTKIEDFSVTYKDSVEIRSSFYDTIRGTYSFYIRNPIIISVTPEQKNDHRYF